jgi:8-hydroxy-5-deazaflavin:NADPH oxidoreductase
MGSMKIGILGSGPVAQTLGAGFIKHGHSVTLGTRDHDKLKDFLAHHKDAKVDSVANAAKFGEIIVLAVKGTAAAQVLAAAGESNLAGKPVIDTTNPIAETPPTNGVLKYFTNLDRSLMEELQEKFPSAHLVKAFNSVGNAAMVDPSFRGGKPSMFIAGNNDAAKKKVSEILDQFGWEVEDMGKAEAARAIEPLCILWCIPGFLRNDWSHAFKVLR